MFSVVFDYSHEVDSDTVRELEIEVTVERAYRSHKLVSVDAITEDGRSLDQSEIEDLVEEIGEDVLANKAAAHGSDEEESLSEKDEMLMDELNIDVA